MNLAVFLLAGRGSRLNKYTEIIPKCMVEVSGKPILHRMLSILLRIGVKKVILVVGYRWEDIYESVGDNWNGIDIQYVNNHEWATTNNIVSFYMAKDLINEDFLLIEGDVIIAQEALDKFISGKNQMAVSEYKSHLDGTVVTLTKNTLVDQMYMKSDIDSTLNLHETYKTVNIYSINNKDFHDLVVPVFERKIKNGKVNIYYEQAFADLLNSRKMEFEAIDYSNYKWYEVDNEEDLKKAEELFPN